jgi:hypothetical protein
MYQLRMGSVATNTTILSSVISSMIMGASHADGEFGFEFDVYDAEGTNDAYLNYLMRYNSTQAVKSLNIVTIKDTDTSNPKLMVNASQINFDSYSTGTVFGGITDTLYVSSISISTNRLSSGTAYVGSLTGSNVSTINLQAQTLDVRTINVINVSTFTVSTQSVLANSLSTGSISSGTATIGDATISSLYLSANPIQLGLNAARGTTQFPNGIAIGVNAGFQTKSDGVAIGTSAGYNLQGLSTIAIGAFAGYDTQGRNAIAIGYNAGFSNQGSNTIAIGFGAGQSNQTANSIVLNASNVGLQASNAGFYVNPIRLDTTVQTGILHYNSTTDEVVYNELLRVTALSTANISSGTGVFGTLNVSTLGGFSPIRVTDTLHLTSSIGIGTSTPTNSLEVVGNTKAGVMTIPSTTGSVQINTSNASFGTLQLTTTSTSENTIFIRDPGQSANNGWLLGNTNSFVPNVSSICIGRVNPQGAVVNTGLFIRSDGNVGIGTSNPSSKLDVIGNGINVLRTTPGEPSIYSINTTNSNSLTQGFTSFLIDQNPNGFGLTNDDAYNYRVYAYPNSANGGGTYGVYNISLSTNKYGNRGDMTILGNGGVLGDIGYDSTAESPKLKIGSYNLSAGNFGNTYQYLHYTKGRGTARDGVDYIFARQQTNTGSYTPGDITNVYTINPNGDMTIGLSSRTTSSILSIYGGATNSAGSQLSLFGGGGASSWVGINLSPFNAGSNDPGARIRVSDNNYSGDFLFQTKTAGSSNNTLQTRAVIKADGSVGISQTNPQSILQISGGIYNRPVANITAENSSAAGQLINCGAHATMWPCDDGTNLRFYWRTGGGTNYTIQIAGAPLFTGQHFNNPLDARIKQNLNDYVGLIVSSADEGYFSIRDVSGVKVELTGEDAITINESLPRIKLSAVDNDKAVWGVITNFKNDAYNQDGTPILDGSNPGWGNELPDSQIRVNGVGEGAIWVTNINGNLENGDYITTSIIPGYGRKQDDDILHSYTVAKITMSCDFQLENGRKYKCEEFEFNGVTYRKAFVGCSYHCS